MGKNQAAKSAQHLCAICKEIIKENLLFVVCDGRGVDRNDPTTWLPLHHTTAPGLKTYCVYKWDIEIDEHAGTLVMTHPEYELSKQGQVPEKYLLELG